MTSDGINTEDWDRVKELACQIVNSSSAGNDRASSKYTKSLLAFLTELQKKYGELPSILATEADYMEDIPERLQLLKRAYALAEKLQDYRNQVLIASSIAEIYIEELADVKNATVWLDLLETNINNSQDWEEVKDLNELKRKLAALKSVDR
jgi:hypothetical protein